MMVSVVQLLHYTHATGRTIRDVLLGNAQKKLDDPIFSISIRSSSTRDWITSLIAWTTASISGDYANTHATRMRLDTCTHTQHIGTCKNKLSERTDASFATQAFQLLQVEHFSLWRELPPSAASLAHIQRDTHRIKQNPLHCFALLLRGHTTPTFRHGDEWRVKAAVALAGCEDEVRNTKNQTTGTRQNGHMMNTHKSFCKTSKNSWAAASLPLTSFVTLVQQKQRHLRLCILVLWTQHSPLCALFAL